MKEDNRTKKDKQIEDSYGIDLREDNKRISTENRRVWEKTRLHAYGYIVVDLQTLDGRTEVRKITPSQRRDIILYYIMTHSGKEIKIKWLAAKLGTRERTIQYELRYLEKEEYIRTEPTILPNGSHGPNRYFYLRTMEDDFFDYKPSLAKVYGPSNSLGLRNWYWNDYKDIPFKENYTHTKSDKIENYTEISAKKEELKYREHKNYVDSLPPIAKKGLRKGRKKK